MPEDKPGDGGVTPSLEELTKQIRELSDARAADQTRITELTSSNERMTQLLEAATRRVETAPTATAAERRKLKVDFAAQWNIPQEAAQTLLETAIEMAKGEMREEYTQAEALKQIASDFYSENPDLTAHKAVVQAMASDLKQKEPTLTLGEALKKTAVKAREYIKNLKGGTNGDPNPATPPAVVPGAPVKKDTANPGAPEPELSPEQELEKEMADRRKQRAGAISGAKG